jgi:hypothetical protein
MRSIRPSWPLPNSRVAKLFRDNMVNIESSTVQFFTLVEAKKLSLEEIETRFIKAAEVLHKRIAEEETTLYPLFRRLTDSQHSK